MTKLIDHDIEKELIAIVKQLLQESGQPYQRDIKLDAYLQRHLGIDSLSRVELFKRIEKHFNLPIPDRLLAEAETLQDLATYLASVEPSTTSIKPSARVVHHDEKSYVDLSSAKTLLDILLLYSNEMPHKAHIYFQDEDGKEEVVTYSQLLKSALQVAHGLRLRGLKEGDMVAIMLPTCTGFFYSFFGVLLAGCVPVPIYPPFRAHLLETYARLEAGILCNAEVRLLITFERAETLSRMLQAFVPGLKVVTTISELLSSEQLTPVFHASPDDFAFIQYTSGSTSDPKGVLLTHKNLLSNIEAYGKAVKVTPDDVIVSWLPLYHDMGLIGMWLGSLYHGIPLVLMTPFSFLNHPERWLWAMHYHRGTLSGAPNFAYELCIRNIEPALLEGLDLSAWRVAANGAEKVYPRTLEQFCDKFAPYGFKRSTMMPVYGLAESTVALAIPPLGRDFRVDKIDREKFEKACLAVPSASKTALEYVGCGMPIVGHDIRIVSESGLVVPERQVGCLQFRGPSCMQGYYNNSRATQAVFHDGWIDSGDLAYLADEEVFITGRQKDLMIKAGRNLYPADLEEWVGQVEGVRQGCVAVFGVQDALRGTEQLVVVAETREKNKQARDHIIDNIQAVLSSRLDLAPDQVVLVAPHTVPKTSSGKLQRRACKAMYLEGRLGRGYLPAWVQVVKLGVKWGIRKAGTAVRQLAELLYTLYMLIVLMTTVMPVYCLVLAGSSSFAETICRLWARGLIRLSGSAVKIVNREKLQQLAPVIYVANHASYLDVLFVFALVPRGTHFVAKKELFSMPVVRTFLRKLKAISIDRMDAPKGLEDAKYMEQILKAGQSIFIFPEGTFGYASGLRPFRLGAFKLAAENQLPICPIALRGTRRMLRDAEKLMRPSRITVTVCDPVRAKGTEWQDVTTLRQVVRIEIAKYCGEAPLDLIAAQVIAPKL